MGAEQPDITIVNTKSSKETGKSLEVHLKEEYLREQSKKARELFNLIQDELEQREEDIKDGLSFLDMKNDTLLSYMIDVCNIILRKVRGDSISGHSSIRRCIEYRVILEKIKTIDQKLAYQLNKLITLPDDATEEDQRIDINNLDVNLDDVASDGEASAIEDDDNDTVDGEDDEQSEYASSLSRDDDEDEESDVDFDSEQDEATPKKPKVRDDESEIEDDSDEVDEEDRQVQIKRPRKPVDKKSKPVGVYKPPKLRSVAYTEDRDIVRGDKGRRKNYDEFYQDEDAGDIVEYEGRDRDDARTRFEEENYTRLPDENPKKSKRKLKTKEYRKKGRNKFKRKRK